MHDFAARLGARNVIAHFRQTRGDDVSAACGQLQQIRWSSAKTTGPS
jgi:adenine C2-methylase RlmN of 23S rRNA A2503 and tRNA A37